MTGGELERAIQFLLESQAKNDAQIAQLGVRADQLTRDVARLTGDFADLKALVKEFAESTRLFAQRADERLDRLEQNAERGDRHRQRLETALAEGAERMNALMRVVEDPSPMKPDTARRRDDVWLQKSRSGRGRPETMNMGTMNDDSPFIIHHSSFIIHRWHCSSLVTG